MSVTALVALISLGSLGVAAPPTPKPAAEAGADTPRADPRPPTPQEAKALLRRPKGSLSFGGTSGGELLDAAELPHSGKGYSIFESMRSRKTNFGTEELIGLIQRTAKRFLDEHPKSPLRVGNLGFDKGGRIPWSVSHQSGRDADIAFFALDKRGRRARLKGYETFGADGWNVGDRKRYRFDATRNLALVEALLADEEVHVQWIFVADHLKALILEEARRQGRPDEVIADLQLVMHQPSDSAPHDDHFHVRVYCSVQDRLHGCLNWGPRRPWAELGDEEFAAHVDKLVGLLTMKQAKWRARALRQLRVLNAQRAAPKVAELLVDDNSRVRREALATLRHFAVPDVVPRIRDALASTDNAGWAVDLLRALYRIRHPEVVSIARAVIETPSEVLSSRVVGKGGRMQSLQRVAADILGRFGKKDAVTPLLELLGSAHRKVRKAAHDALLRVTNQRIRGRITSGSKRVRARVVEAWKSFLGDSEDSSWLQWMRLGFEQRGYRFKGKMMSHRSIPVLIRAVGDKDEVVSHNAIRVLGELTGHVVDPTWRSTRGNVRHWKSWWRKNKERFASR